MGNSRPKQLARFGLFYLEEAVSDVLFEATQRGKCLSPADISNTLGIPPRLASGVNRNEIARAVLDRLEVEGGVEYCPDDKRKWQLTAEEFEGRRDE